jgi:hypothetical protein
LSNCDSDISNRTIGRMLIMLMAYDMYNITLLFALNDTAVIENANCRTANQTIGRMLIMLIAYEMYNIPLLFDLNNTAVIEIHKMCLFSLYP